MQVDYPYSFDGRGRTAETSADDHIRDLIEQVLFTAPGERVNRPTFGSGVGRLVFAPNSDAVAATAQLAVQGALQTWLADLILVDAVEADNIDSMLQITVRYRIRGTQEQRTAQFQGQGA